MNKLDNYINGEFSSPHSNEYLDNEAPATGEVFNRVANSSQEDVEKAIMAADDAFEGWSNTPLEEREQCLLKVATLLEKNAAELAELESKDTGKPISMTTQVDIPRSHHNIHTYIKAMSQFTSKFYDMDSKALNYVLHRPLGVVASISPWNFPLYLLTWKAAPALLTGNTLVAKPSEVTPTTANKLAELLSEAKFPKGVFNIIHGQGPRIGPALVTDKRVKAVSFTGSTKTGREIATMAAPFFKKVSLEMGGKNPTVIFDDADIEKASDFAVKAAFTNQGQVCLCGSRIFIHQSIYERVKKILLEKTSKLIQGDPFDPATQQGAMVSKVQYDKVLSYLKVARDLGGDILCGGEAAQIKGFEKGYFIRPTLIENLPNDCSFNQEEIFGPVASLIPFENDEQGVELANSVEYGLSANLWTQNLSKAHKMAQKLEAGVVWVNTWMLRDLRTPFGE